MPLLRVPRVLRVGTDFSGMDMPLTALSHIMAHSGGSPRVRHVFSCDCSAGCQKYIRLCHPECQHVYNNIMERDQKTTPPCDLYCCGAALPFFLHIWQGAGRR